MRYDAGFRISNHEVILDIVFMENRETKFTMGPLKLSNEPNIFPSKNRYKKACGYPLSGDIMQQIFLSFPFHVNTTLMGFQFLYTLIADDTIDIEIFQACKRNLLCYYKYETLTMEMVSC